MNIKGNSKKAVFSGDRVIRLTDLRPFCLREFSVFLGLGSFLLLLFLIVFLKMHV